MNAAHSSYISRWSEGMSPELKRSVYECIADGLTTMREVVERTNLDASTVKKAMYGLRKHGFIYAHYSQGGTTWEKL